MSDKPILYTADGADKVIPKLTGLLPILRSMRDEVIRTQNKCDVEEIASFGTTGGNAEEARRKMDEYRMHARLVEREFERKLKIFEELGCELKGLDPGLIDFYAERDGELVYLCWREGETRISFWHPLSTGFAGRRPLP